MRDALTAFDQVVAFAGTTITVDDVSSVLGLVGRDLLLDILEAVADERATAAFELAGRAIEAGYDLRLLCRELSRLVRDLMLVVVDKTRLKDPAVVPDGERERIEAPRRAVLARGSAARVRSRRAHRGGAARRPPSRATTSRWRCSSGSTCASWRRSPS